MMSTYDKQYMEIASSEVYGVYVRRDLITIIGTFDAILNKHLSTDIWSVPVYSEINKLQRKVNIQRLQV